MKSKNLCIGLVGVCGAGKSTLKNNLANYPYRVRQIAQEHSYVPDMWERLANPDVLIFLEASYPISQHRKSFSWTEAEYQEQLHRLRHAYRNADLFINTDEISPEEVLDQVLTYLQEYS
jgi:deoxyadenosine/deoxycytidine kinase